MAPFLLSHSEKGPPAPHQYWVYVFMYCAAVISPNVSAYLHNSFERSDQSAKQIRQMPRKESGTPDFSFFLSYSKTSPAQLSSIESTVKIVNILEGP